jgi:hypothetical protein
MLILKKVAQFSNVSINCNLFCSGYVVVSPKFFNIKNSVAINILKSHFQEYTWYLRGMALEQD